MSTLFWSQVFVAWVQGTEVNYWFPRPLCIFEEFSRGTLWSCHEILPKDDGLLSICRFLTNSILRKVSYLHLHYVFIAHLVLNEIISACSKHWILIVLIPKRSLAYYIDSLKQSSTPLDLSFIQGFLSRYILAIYVVSYPFV